MQKRLLSTLLALAMVISMLPASVLAEDVESGQETVPTVTETVPEEPVPEPTPEPEPVTEPIIEPATEPVTEPEAEAATEPETQPETEPATEVVTEPVQRELAIEGVHEGYVGDQFQLKAHYSDGTVPETVTWETMDKSIVAIEEREDDIFAVLLAPGTAEIIAKDSGGLTGRFSITVLETATEAPTEEATEAPTEAPTEQSTEAPTEPAEATPIQVIFSCSPAETTLCVFPAGEDVDSAIDAEQDGSYSLLPGDYAYLAAAVGYEPFQGFFTLIEDTESPSTVVVVLTDASENSEFVTLGAKVIASGNCGADTIGGTLYSGKNVQWELTDDGVLTIFGKGRMENYTPTLGTYPKYNQYSSKITSVIVKEGVTSIGMYAFFRFYNITSVTLPQSLASIETGAFQNCSNLTSITIPNSVTSIGKEAFCVSGLINITIPGSVTVIGEKCFNYCNLRSVTLVDGVKGIGAYAFYGNSKLREANIPNSVTSIGAHAFESCNCITSITIPENASLGDYAFRYCNRLTDVTIQDGVTEISQYAFSNCSSLANVTIPESVTSIGNYAFENCSSLAKIAIPASVIKIGRNAFDGSGLTDVTVPGDATQIGSYVFANCHKLTSVVFQNGVSKIPSCSFENCKALTSITIPDGVLSIENYAFSGCSSLTSITIPDSVASMADSIFRDCTGLVSIVMPDSIKQVSSYTFYNCTGLTNVTIPHRVTSIGSYAFSGCTSLSGITIPDSVTSVGSYAFSGCTSLDNVTIPGSLSTIASYMFSNCSSLTALTIPQSITKVLENAFYMCKSLQTVYYGGNSDSWKKVTIQSGNSALRNANIQYDHACVLTEVPAKAPTSTEDGNNQYWICTVCGKAYKDALGKVETTVEAETIPAKPAVTALTKVAGTGGSFTATWNAQQNVDGYALQYATNSSFTSCVTVMVYGGNVTSTTVKNLAAGTYYVRVRTFKTVGNSKTYSLASSALTVTVGSSKPTATTLTKVTSGDSSFTAAWSAQQNADGYALQYATNSSFTSCKTVMVYGGNVTSTTVKDLTAGTYYIRVRTFKTVGNSKTYSLASSALTVTVGSSKPTVTTLTKVTSGDGSFTATWNAQQNVDGYALQYATNSSFTSCKTVMVYGSNVTSKTVSGLTAGTYYVRVRTFKTVDGSKVYSLASSALTVTVASSKPTATTLTKVTSGDGSFTATWNAQQNVDGYALQYATNSSFTSCKTVMVYGAGTASKTVSGLTAGTYYVRVRTFKTVDGSKVYSLASSALTVTVGSSKPTATALTKVTGGEGSFTATWNAQQNVDGYALQYATNSSFTSCKTVMLYNASATSTIVNGLSGGTYYVRIRTYRVVDGVKVYSLASDSLKVTVK